ncbi:hypothetical protein PspCFBP13528_15170 [Pseudomonas sp. CFBP13528]|nr:hypothetical protein PspCFBP13528_15170 [Pseudomonas sp. CFBP13528]
MQGQKAYVNDYVVIILRHYIKRCGGGKMQEKRDLGVIFRAVGRVIAFSEVDKLHAAPVGFSRASSLLQPLDEQR